MPRAYRERTGSSLPPDFDAATLSSLLGDLAGKIAIRNLSGRALDGQRDLAALMQRMGGGTYASWLVVDKDGLRLRVHY